MKTILFTLLLQFQVYLPLVVAPAQCPCTCAVSTTTSSSTTSTTIPHHQPLAWLTSDPACLTFNGKTQEVRITGRGFASGVKVFVGTMAYFPLNVIDQHNATFTVPGDYLQEDHFGGQIPESVLAYLTSDLSDSDFYFFCIQF